MHWWHWRRRLRSLRRHPLWFWLVTLGLAGLTALTALQVGGRSSAAVARWGRLASVVVMARPVAAGAVVEAGDVRVEVVPARVVPSGGVASVEGVVGRVALVGLWPGEMVLRSRLAPDGLRGVAALVPEGMRAVALPMAGGGGLRVAVGDTVDVVATFEVDPSEGGAGVAGPPTVVVVEGASVVDVQEESVTVAVPAADAPRLAFAAARATLTLALTPVPLQQSTSPPDVDYSEGAGR